MERPPQQVDEIPAELAASPLRFAEWTRARRNAAADAATALQRGSSTMKPKDVSQPQRRVHAGARVFHALSHVHPRHANAYASFPAAVVGILRIR
jgi:hypothetical protein